MTTVQLGLHPDASRRSHNGEPCIALVGNPNAGKTTLFNQLTGLRAKTANFPGTTIEHRTGRVALDGTGAVMLLDLPGLYSLVNSTNEERVARDAILGRIPSLPRPTAMIVIMDATNLERNFFLASQALEMGVPTLVALNMIDLAERHGARFDVHALSRELNCPVVAISARYGRGIDQLRHALLLLLHPDRKPSEPFTKCTGCAGCPFTARYNWAEGVGAKVITAPGQTHGQRTEKIDRFLTHPLVGVIAFATVMFAMFVMIFWLAQYPMDAIETLFATVGAHAGRGLSWLAGTLPPGALGHFLGNDLRSLVVEGVIGGVGGVLVFLPQIGILFFFLSLLEDTGYLARAAFVMDRLMRRVGLPGKAFVPMLSAHACAVPAIMSARVIEDRRDRLITILVLPLLTCSARIPIYAMVVALLFPHAPIEGALLFTGAYALGVVAALSMAWFLKRTILKGETKPLVLELPSYKMPSLRNALYTMIERAMIFVRKAGTVILIASVVLWLLSHYPKSAPPAEAVALAQQSHAQSAQGHPDQAADLAERADQLTAQHSLRHSLAGDVGHVIEPVLRPLGMDWQMGIGILSSFSARETFVSTLAVVYGVGADASDNHPARLYDTLRSATRTDGSPVFTAAACISLLIFYVLAMQCMSTTAIVRRETNSWRWPLFQFAYMTALAYTCALLAFQTLHLFGIA